MPRQGYQKELKPKEKEFVECMLDTGLGAIEAARKVFGWRCEPKSREAQRAQDLARTRRVLLYRKEYQDKKLNEAKAKKMLQHQQGVDLDKLRSFAYRKLLDMATDVDNKSQVRFNAVKALEDLTDPSKDISLILRWVSLAWMGLNAHCPCCHNDFPLWKVENKIISDYLQEIGEPFQKEEDLLKRKLLLLSKADNRKTPHQGQLAALAAKERNIVGTGSARSGKSFLLASFAFLTLLVPGIEVWILARIYEDARSEIDYLRAFLRTAFHPFTQHLIKESYDSKTGELSITTKWGSELRVRSAKSKGSITGRELELALIAEPGWVQDDIFNHLRARMSSRLGRIILLGTPQGFGGILGRMVNMVGRDPVTNRIIRISPEQRTLEAGCRWDISMLYLKLSPEDNPEYVKSELDAARMELMDEEYATEFAGEMGSSEGSLFPQIKPRLLIPIPRVHYLNTTFVLGVDQGPTNFAYCVVGWDGKVATACIENYDPEPKTMKAKLKQLRQEIPGQILKFGGVSENLRVTIFDTDPPLTNELRELEEEGSPWLTPVSFKHRNTKSKHIQENWRKETYEFINELAAQGRLIFDAETCYLLHDDLMRVRAKSGNSNLDVDRGFGKGWEINNPWRKDHVLDSFILAMWAILSGQVPLMGEAGIKAQDAFVEAKNAFMYDMKRRERAELSGFSSRDQFVPQTADELFEESFGRPRDSGFQDAFVPSCGSYYKDY